MYTSANDSARRSRKLVEDVAQIRGRRLHFALHVQRLEPRDCQHNLPDDQCADVSVFGVRGVPEVAERRGEEVRRARAEGADRQYAERLHVREERLPAAPGGGEHLGVRVNAFPVALVYNFDLLRVRSETSPDGWGDISTDNLPCSLGRSASVGWIRDARTSSLS